MSSRPRFCWYDHVQIVYGIYRAAIYDFHSGVVYSLNHAAAQTAHCLDTGILFAQMSPQQQTFASQLRALQLGGWVETQAKPERVELIPEGQHPLTFLWLELSGNCNLGCVHCYAESQNSAIFPGASTTRSSGQPLLIAEWRNVLRAGADLGCRQVQFIGGEALLYPHLIELIDAAQEDGYTFIEIFTNGTLLTERKVQMLAERNVHLAVSLHGTEADVHDSVTGLPGSFARTMAGLRRLRAYGIPFRLAGTAVKSNQYDVIHIHDIATDLGATESSFDVVRGVGSGVNPELMPDDAEVLAQKWLTWPTFSASRADFEHNRRWNPCWAGKLAVSSTGDVMPCVMGRSQVVGNIHEESLAEILNKPDLLRLWGLTKDQVAVCQDCEYRYVCGDCRPLAASGGDLHGAIPRCTYNPQDGTWGWPGTETRRPGPAPEDVSPLIAHGAEGSMIALLQVNGKSPGKNVHFRCDPDSRELDDLTWPQLNHFRCEPDNRNDENGAAVITTFDRLSNHHFQCDPDR